MDTHRFIGRRALRTLLVLSVAAALLAPVAVVAAGGAFIDDEDSVFEGDIDWLAAAGVTLGCNPPTNDRFCPDSNVTRGQMAAFMHRLAENQVVDAASAVEAESADELDGLDSTAFLKDDVITITQSSGFVPNAGTGSTVEHYSNADLLGAGGNQLALTVPTMVGADSFFLAEVEICYNAVAAGDQITRTAVYQSTTSNTSSLVVDDSTPRTSVYPADECYQVTASDPVTPTSSGYRLYLNVSGSVRVFRVTSSYVPTDGGTINEVQSRLSANDATNTP